MSSGDNPLYIARSGTDPCGFAISMMAPNSLSAHWSGAVIGVFCGTVPLVIGLIRGHRYLAWTGFGFSIVLGLGCYFAAVVPALIFTIIVAATEPIEKKKKARLGGSRRRRRERADDFLDEDAEKRRRRRREGSDDDDRPRRRRRYDEEDD